VLQPTATPVSRLQAASYLSAFKTALMNAEPFGVPRPVTLSQPGPVVRDESVPKVKTSQRVDAVLWNNALTNSFVLSKGCARAEALSNVTGALGGLKMKPVTSSKVSIGFRFTRFPAEV
jgi:hypothetical protein